MRFTMRKEKCAECGAPMRRTGFNENQRGDTVFTYQCEKCGYTMKKTLKRGVAAGTMRNDLGAPEADALRAELRRLPGEVRRLEEDKRELERRNAFLARELDETRAKVPTRP